MKQDVLTFITFLWEDERFPKRFTFDDVRVLYSMLRRNVSKPFNLICFSDTVKTSTKYSIDIETPYKVYSSLSLRPIWKAYGKTTGNQVNCFRRLFCFSEEFSELVRGRITMLDLDVVITGDITDLCEDDVWYWEGGIKGCFWTHTTGTKTWLWDCVAADEFKLPSGSIGSDMAWLNYALEGEDLKVVTKDHGIYNYIPDGVDKMEDLPANARMVFMQGDPKIKQVLGKHEWMREHYR